MHEEVFAFCFPKSNLQSWSFLEKMTFSSGSETLLSGFLPSAGIEFWGVCSQHRAPRVPWLRSERLAEHPRRMVCK